ncbi:MAG: hypothetical protein P4M08_10235 [Oligoflexia bacterium]|nr:hypothetical protein [Oligoflexia bacterium]
MANPEKLRPANPTHLVPEVDSLGVWVGYWITHLEDLKQKIMRHVEANTEFEALNQYVFSDLRQLVSKAGLDAYRLRVKRYRKDAGKNVQGFQKTLWWLRSKRLQWKYTPRKIVYGAYEKYDTAVDFDTAKAVHISCGYCGVALGDNSIRPSSTQKLPSQLLEIIKGKRKIQLLSVASLARFDKTFRCPQCHETSQCAYINKIARTVVVVFL